MTRKRERIPVVAPVSAADARWLVDRPRVEGGEDAQTAGLSETVGETA
jgi:hypothetical protein